MAVRRTRNVFIRALIMVTTCLSSSWLLSEGESLFGERATCCLSAGWSSLGNGGHSSREAMTLETFCVGSSLLVLLVVCGSLWTVGGRGASLAIAVDFLEDLRRRERRRRTLAAASLCDEPSRTICLKTFISFFTYGQFLEDAS